MSGSQELELEPAIDPEELRSLCKEVSFAPGETIRVKGEHYFTMFVLTDGEVEITLEKKGKAPTVLTRGRGAPIGEINFLTGRPATALVKASVPTRALEVSNEIMAELERERPEFAANLYRQLAEVVGGRQSYNVVFFSEDAASGKAPPDKVEVRTCRNQEMLRVAQRIRYEVYCEELGRTSPFADKEQRILADDLDSFAYVLLAFDGETPVGTMRLNRPNEGPLGALEQIYGMAACPNHPEYTSICTKFIVRKSHRYGQASFKLMATSVHLGLQRGIKNCYIDCIPTLLPFYMSLGFRQSAPPFLHRENGRSIPLMLDMEKYGQRISRLTGFALR